MCVYYTYSGMVILNSATFKASLSQPKPIQATVYYKLSKTIQAASQSKSI